MSKPAPRQSSTIKILWRVINLIGLAIALFIPIVDDQTFGTINYLNILSVMLMFLPGVIFQAVSTPGKLPGLFLYVGGLISLISLIIYLLLEGIGLVWLRKKRKNLRSLFLLTMSGIGVFAILFLWQGHLTHGAAIIVTALISSLVLEFVELVNR
ncbi:hypothetical protein [Leptolyngbya sp. NIES-2104]|uniref:hypothetical protein n=1 Tax=Leptolyngbya sp. NIES-2104 TaxID=1552121 RepID=UPI0006ECAB83|nr:hypothetical protein [Leptolyngbya sp. NIES-2104]GAP98499.1 hypothetical protein NIES2104_50540 [Leptolyngbya sp. NIES-2104]